ncbi:hypothetical protein AJ80_08979 [Polytolypa hystricis UAMH7299]|uniref:DUF676 domain-containing protein n=1 Tax=Polytolypa hystricis (strain UAMH7299) TaxID=1447883 RepID=A0A2B7WYI8_POLH7|nr:hypothetical protein AJ80_08979 [Polytolypa hystricis UAMH7299]
MEVDFKQAPPKAKLDHICVLVHGLYGQPSHFDYVASALREKHGNDLYILVPKSNKGSLTYDGIELGGERVAFEIEEALVILHNLGHNIRKMSIVGYSLGGLVARYAIGLLYTKGHFDKLECVNFTTFATPHVGVRSPARRNHFWNVVGARTISESGRQLFMIDSFRDTGKPLLGVLATPGSIFMLALEKFKHRSLYANIVNDRAAVFYTTGISRIDPFAHLDKVDINYVKGYASVVVDLDHSVDLRQKTQTTRHPLGQISSHGLSILQKLPFHLFVVLFVTISSIVYLLNSVIQTMRSKKRIRLHHQGKSGFSVSSYRDPLFMEEMQNAVDDMYESVNASHQPEYLSQDEENTENQDLSSTPFSQTNEREPHQSSGTEKLLTEDPAGCRSSSRMSRPTPHTQTTDTTPFPTLALTMAQFEIIDALNSVGFRKYPVYIHNDKHSHAAMIVRFLKKTFDEGKTVIRHWLDEEFRP